MQENTGRSTGQSTGTEALRIGMIGTRGVPAAYGGFETAIEEIGSRLAERGHDVVVHCRRGNAAKLSGDPATPDPTTHRGMRLVHLPAVRGKAVETLSHTTMSGLRHLVRRDTDVNFVFNPANAPLLPLLRGADTPVVVHVDGLDWKRGKWGPVGRAYYRRAEALSVRWADALGRWSAWSSDSIVLDRDVQEGTVSINGGAALSLTRTVAVAAPVADPDQVDAVELGAHAVRAALRKEDATRSGW